MARMWTTFILLLSPSVLAMKCFSSLNFPGIKIMKQSDADMENAPTGTTSAHFRRYYANFCSFDVDIWVFTLIFHRVLTFNAFWRCLSGANRAFFHV